MGRNELGRLRERERACMQACACAVQSTLATSASAPFQDAPRAHKPLLAHAPPHTHNMTPTLSSELMPQASLICRLVVLPMPNTRRSAMWKATFAGSVTRAI